jgi:NitT/TauT family transport system substrate-binding protein
MMRLSSSRSAFLAALPLAALALRRPALAQATVVRVGATANDTYGEAYYAVDMGFFSKAGLDVQIQTFSNGAAVAAGVASGALDVGVTNPIQLAHAVASNIPFAYFAGGGLYSTNAPATVIVVAKDSPMRVAKDLEGKTVANPTLKDLTYLATVAFLAQGGADPTKVQMTEMPFSEMGAALQRGTIAAAIISEPSLSAAIAAGQARSFGKVFDAISPRFLISGWFTTKSWYAANAPVANRFAQVIYQTARWANIGANHEKSGQILAKYSKLPLETVRGMVRCTFSETLTPAQLDPMLAMAAKANLIPRLVTGAELIVKV